MIVNTEKNIEFYFIALNIFDHPPEATIYAKLGRNKYINLIFKLPILMNRFLILETELDISEFKIKWDDDEYSELIINNVKRKAVSNFEHLCKLFEYHLILGEKKIAGIIKFLNRKKIFLDFIIDYEEKESIINLKFCFGVAKKIKNNEKIFLKSMIDKLNMLFEKILKFDPLYD